MLANLRTELIQLGIDDQIMLGLALLPVFIEVMEVIWSPDADTILTTEQIKPMRVCMAAGWLVDFDGDSYHLYGPTGERTTLDHLDDLEEFAIDLAGDGVGIDLEVRP
jgi:hypothetical protein